MIRVDTEDYFNDRSTTHRLVVGVCRQRFTLEWHKTMSRRKMRRLRAAHDEEMARIRAQLGLHYPNVVDP